MAAATVVLLCATVATISVVVDPGTIYLRRYFSSEQTRAYAQTLIDEPVGLTQRGNERTTKQALASLAPKRECVIIGSSRVLQLSTVRSPSAIGEACATLLNLGVSGGTLEDLLAFSHILLAAEQLPDKLIVGADPWMLKFGMDTRFGLYQLETAGMLEVLSSDGGKVVPYRRQLLLNLLNLEYLRASIELLGSDDYTWPWHRDEPEGGPAVSIGLELRGLKPFPYEQGGEQRVTLSDGSHVYSAADLATKTKAWSKLKPRDGAYKIEGEVLDESAVEVYRALLQRLRAEGPDVRLLLLPYHPVVFTTSKKGPRKHIEAAEARILSLARSLDLAVIGSYDPRKVGCTAEEFHDAIHPKTACMNRLGF